MNQPMRKDGYYMPEGRTFAEVPRVLRCHNDGEAVIFFHGADNPYGNPRETFQKWKTHPIDQQKIRLYGVAEKMTSARYARFNQ